jgi:hypothetical protein
MKLFALVSHTDADRSMSVDIEEIVRLIQTDALKTIGLIFGSD